MSSSKFVTACCNLLRQHESFQDLVLAWDQHQALAQLVHAFLTDLLKPHVQLSGIQKGVVTLAVRSNSWATQCRYQIPALLSHLRQHPDWAGLAHIQLRVEAEAFELIPINQKRISTVSRASKALIEAIQTYAETTENIEQKQACQQWLNHMQVNLALPFDAESSRIA